MGKLDCVSVGAVILKVVCPSICALDAALTSGGARGKRGHLLKQRVSQSRVDKQRSEWVGRPVGI